jgi:hypothetical protein
LGQLIIWLRLVKTWITTSPELFRTAALEHPGAAR